MKGGVIPVRGAMVHTGELELVQEDFQGGVIHRGGGMIAMELPHSPLCSFSCSFRCFLKLKDFPQVGSEQVKVFWCTCWYFWWCCRGEKKPLSAPNSSSRTPLPGSPVLQGSAGLCRCSRSGTGGWRRFCHSLRSRTGGSHALLPS